MARCIDCAWFPWAPGADYSMLPAMKCAKELEARRWTKETAALEHSCPYYEGPKAVKENDADTGTQDKVEKVAGRKTPRRRK